MTQRTTLYHFHPRRRGQIKRMGFTRDPDQPLFFGPDADPEAAFAWIASRRRAVARRGRVRRALVRIRLALDLRW